MNEQDIVIALQKIPIFHGLDHRQLQSLAKLIYEREYPAGETIVTQGESGVGLFIVVSGKAEAVRQRADGTQAVVNHFGPTDFFGELALLDEGARTASVVAIEPVHCLGILRWDFQTFLKKDAEMSLTVLTELARRFRMALEASL